MIKIDLGCGKNKRKDGEWFGVDIIENEGIDLVMDAREYLKTLSDGVVEEVNMCHFLEHLDGAERVDLFNELYRVLNKNGKIYIVCPNWSHERAYGDPTHKWPPVCTWTFFYLDKNWRDLNAPHCGYTCDFDYSIMGVHDQNDSWVSLRNQETKVILMSRNINTTTDIVVTLNKKEIKCN